MDWDIGPVAPQDEECTVIPVNKLTRCTRQDEGLECADARFNDSEDVTLPGVGDDDVEDEAEPAEQPAELLAPMTAEQTAMLARLEAEGGTWSTARQLLMDQGWWDDQCTGRTMKKSVRDEIKKVFGITRLPKDRARARARLASAIELARTSGQEIDPTGTQALAGAELELAKLRELRDERIEQQQEQQEEQQEEQQQEQQPLGHGGGAGTVRVPIDDKKLQRMWGHHVDWAFAGDTAEPLDLGHPLADLHSLDTSKTPRFTVSNAIDMSPADLFMAVYPGGSDKFKADAKKIFSKNGTDRARGEVPGGLGAKTLAGCNQEQSLKKFYGAFIGASQVCIRIKNWLLI